MDAIRLLVKLQFERIKVVQVKHSYKRVLKKMFNLKLFTRVDGANLVYSRILKLKAIDQIKMK